MMKYSALDAEDGVEDAVVLCCSEAFFVAL